MASRFGMGMSITQPPGFPSHHDDSNNWTGPYGRNMNSQIFVEEEAEEDERKLAPAREPEPEDTDVETFKLRGSGCPCGMCPTWLCVLCLILVIFICMAAVIVPVALTQRNYHLTQDRIERVNEAGRADGRVDVPGQTVTEATDKPKVTKGDIKTTKSSTQVPDRDKSTDATTESTSTTTTIQTTSMTTTPQQGLELDLTKYYNSSFFTTYANTRSQVNTTRKLVGGVQGLKGCEEECTKSHSPLCFGIDIELTLSECYLILDQNYFIGPRGGSALWYHKKRDVRVASSCKYTSQVSNNKPYSTATAQVQGAEIDSPEKCRRVCESSFMVPSGKHCRVAAFLKTNKTCYLFDEDTTPSHNRNWESYIVDFKCNVTFVPYIEHNFATSSGTVPADILSLAKPPTTHELLNVDPAACAEEACRMASRLSTHIMCHDFIHEPSTDTCYIVTTAGSQIDMQDKIYYRRGLSSGGSCADVEESPNTSGRGVKMPLGGPADITKEACQEKCQVYGKDPNGGGRCYGYDLGDNGSSCVAILKSGYELSDSSNTTNYRRNLLCEAAAFPHFISTINTMPSGGIPMPSSDIMECATQCIRAVYPTCYGFAFNHVTLVCFHYQSFDYSLGPVGFHPGVVHYRRQFQEDNSRTNDCEETYTSTPNLSVAAPGLVQPWDINTLDRCKDRCMGLSLSTQQVCYSFDFSMDRSTCTLHSIQHRDNSLAFTPGVNHYKRDKICDLVL